MLTDHELSAMVHALVYKFNYHPISNPPFAIDQGLALDAALQVAWDVDIQAPDSDPSCRVKLLLRRPSQPEIAFGTTVARALCLAALRASGVAVEDDGGGE